MMFSPATLFKLLVTKQDIVGFSEWFMEIIRFQLDGFRGDLERGDLKRESKPLTAEGIVSFKTELRVKKNGSHFKSRDLLVQRFTSSVSGSHDLFFDLHVVSRLQLKIS